MVKGDKMNKITIAVCLIFMLLLVGCSGKNSQNKLANKAEEKYEQQEEYQEQQEQEQEEFEESQEKVNFKCVIAGVQTIYFLRDKAKIESVGRESWLNDDGFFAIMEVNEKEYLVQFPAEESEITFEGMMTTYDVSRTNDAYDCELDVVTEEIVTLPDLEIISNQEYGDLLIEGFGF